MAFRHFTRLLVIAKSLARYDALFLLELHPAGVTLARFARALWRPKSAVKGLRDSRIISSTRSASPFRSQSASAGWTSNRRWVVKRESRRTNQ